MPCKIKGSGPPVAARGSCPPRTATQTYRKQSTPPSEPLPPARLCQRAPTSPSSPAPSAGRAPASGWGAEAVELGGAERVAPVPVGLESAGFLVLECVGLVERAKAELGDHHVLGLLVGEDHGAGDVVRLQWIDGFDERADFGRVARKRSVDRAGLDERDANVVLADFFAH